jgi:spoIIIJ-associated protein
MSSIVSRAGKLDHDAAVSELRRFLDATIGAAHFDLRYRIDRLELAPEAAAVPELETPEIVVVFDGADRDLLLERGAELLKALEYIAVRWLRLDPQFHDRVRFDCGNYRASRLAELRLSAEVAAQRVRETRLPFRFNPMTPRERRIIHLVLKDQSGVRTSSEGLGDERRVVLFPGPGAGEAK